MDPATFAAAGEHIAKIGAPKILAAVQQHIHSRRWRQRVANAALSDVPEPRPRRAVAKWLAQPDTIDDLLTAPNAPGADVTERLDAHLSATTKGWAALPKVQRRSRAETILLGIYNKIFEAHSIVTGLRISTTRLSAHAQQTQQAVERVDNRVAQLHTAVEQQRNASSEAELNERLRLLPPLMHQRVRNTYRDHPADAWRLIVALTGVERPSHVLTSWTPQLPAWLEQAAADVHAAAGELATAYGHSTLAAELFDKAAAGGIARRSYWQARAAWQRHTSAGSCSADQLRETTRHLPDGDPDPMVRTLHALSQCDASQARTHLARWQPDDPVEAAIAVGMARYIELTDNDGQVTLDHLNAALAVTEAALQERFYGGLALARAHDLILRARLHAGQPQRDLREARQLATRTRDERRTWRGPSDGATAIAIEAALHAGDSTSVLTLGRTRADGGEATDDEAAARAVVTLVLTMEAARGRLSEGTDLSGLVPHDQAVVAAHAARRAGEDPRPHWRNAYDTAGDDQERLQALFQLARAGEIHLPDHRQLLARYPDAAAELNALTLHAAGASEEATTALRQLARQSMSAAWALMEIHRDNGRIDQAVAVLRQAAQDYQDPDFNLEAAVMLARNDQTDDARAEINAVLASALPDWSGRITALRIAAELAHNTGDTPAAIRHLTAALDLDPADLNTRWTLIHLRLSQGEDHAAWQLYRQHPDELDHRNAQDARAALHLHRQNSAAEVTVRLAVQAARRYSDDEAFVASAAAVAMTAGAEDNALSDELAQDVRILTEDFVERFPDSERLWRIHEDSTEALIERMRDMLRVPDETRKARRELEVLIGRNNRPLGFLTTAAGASYAVALIQRTGMTLPAWDPDPIEHTTSVASAQAALGGTVTLEPSAAVALAALPAGIRPTLRGLFSRIIVTTDALDDARSARDRFNIGGRSGTISLDERTGQLNLQELTDEMADHYQAEADAILNILRAATLTPTPPRQRPAAQAAVSPGEPDDELDIGPAPWLSAHDHALTSGTPLWSDDATLRNYIRKAGGAAFSTRALIDAAVNAGHLDRDQADTAIRKLLHARIAAAPLIGDHILEMAEEEQWAVGAAAIHLNRPAHWQQPVTAYATYRAVLTQIRTHQPNAAADWLYLAARGLALALAPTPDAAITPVAALLAATIADTGAVGTAACRLLEATRLALAEHHPDPDAHPDPLLACASILYKPMAATLGEATAAQFLSATFAACDDIDRSAITRWLLTVERAEPL